MRGHDSDELRAQLSVLQTQVAGPTAAPEIGAPEGFCEALELWRDLAQEHESTANTIDRSLLGTRELLKSLLHQASSVVLPLAPPGSPERELSDLIQEWNSATEAWHIALTDRYAARQTREERTATAARDGQAVIIPNDIVRALNPYLVSVCDLEPIDPYAK